MSERPQNKHLKPWKPGQSGNPGGRPTLPEELRAIKELTKEEVKRLFSKHLRATPPELLVVVKDQKASALDSWLAAGILKGIDQGDFSRLGFMLERVIGKPETVQEDPGSSWAEAMQILLASGITMDAIVQHLAQKRAG